MNTEEQVRAAASPQEALLAVARALDKLLAPQPAPDSWGSWTPRRVDQTAAAVKEHYSEPLREAFAAERALLVEDEDKTDVLLQPVSKAKYDKRAVFEQQQLKLSEHLGDDEDWCGIYAQGGPMWLYLGNRDLFMTYPEHTRSAMVADVLEDSPQDADEMARDVLKQPCADGPGGTGMHIDETAAPVRA